MKAALLVLLLAACGSADDIANVCEKDCPPSGSPTVGNYGPAEKR